MGQRILRKLMELQVQITLIVWQTHGCSRMMLISRLCQLYLATNRMIGLEASKKTIDSTTQMAVRDFTHTTGGRRLKPYHWVLYKTRLDVDVFTDTFLALCKSLRGNTCSQIFATAFYFACVFPLKKKGDAHEGLDEFFTQVGVPRKLIPDNAKELTQGQFKKIASKAQCPIRPIEA